MLPPNTAGMVSECLATGKPTLRVETPIGPRVLSWSFFPVKFNNRVHCYAGDITERKRGEETLRASQQLIEGIINAIPVRVFWKDKNFVYLGCNAVFARDAGFAEPKDLIGKDDYQWGGGIRRNCIAPVTARSSRAAAPGSRRRTPDDP